MSGKTTAPLPSNPRSALQLDIGGQAGGAGEAMLSQPFFSPKREQLLRSRLPTSSRSVEASWEVSADSRFLPDGREPHIGGRSRRYRLASPRRLSCEAYTEEGNWNRRDRSRSWYWTFALRQASERTYPGPAWRHAWTPERAVGPGVVPCGRHFCLEPRDCVLFTTARACADPPTPTKR